jgi:hypothetical protein
MALPSQAAFGRSLALDVGTHLKVRTEESAMVSLPRRVALASIRAVHTLIFAVILTCIGWLVWTGGAGRRDRSVGLAAVLVAAEAAVWIANDRVCPLTPLAERLGAERGSVSDIFLPEVVARALPIWSSALLAVAAVLHARSALTNFSHSGIADAPEPL